MKPGVANCGHDQKSSWAVIREKKIMPQNRQSKGRTYELHQMRLGKSPSLHLIHGWQQHKTNQVIAKSLKVSTNKNRLVLDFD